MEFFNLVARKITKLFPVPGLFSYIVISTGHKVNMNNHELQVVFFVVVGTWLVCAAPERQASRFGLGSQRSAPYLRPSSASSHACARGGPSNLPPSNNNARGPSQNPWALPSAAARLEPPPANQRCDRGTRWGTSSGAERQISTAPHHHPQPGPSRASTSAAGVPGPSNQPGPSSSHAFFGPSVRGPQRRHSGPPSEVERLQQNAEARRAVATNNWRTYLRERIVTLGYRTAGEVWMRSQMFAAGNFSENDAEVQGEYARWCRDTLIGFERRVTTSSFRESYGVLFLKIFLGKTDASHCSGSLILRGEKK